MARLLENNFLNEINFQIDVIIYAMVETKPYVLFHMYLTSLLNPKLSKFFSFIITINFKCQKITLIFKFLGYKFEYNLLVKLDNFVNFYWH
jgi:hypothetical protein